MVHKILVHALLFFFVIMSVVIAVNDHDGDGTVDILEGERVDSCSGTTRIDYVKTSIQDIQEELIVDVQGCSCAQLIGLGHSFVEGDVDSDGEVTCDDFETLYSAILEGDIYLDDGYLCGDVVKPLGTLTLEDACRIAENAFETYGALCRDVETLCPPPETEPIPGETIFASDLVEVSPKGTGDVVAYYHFDDGGIDSSGYGNDGIILGGYTPGVSGYSYNFNGIDSYLFVEPPVLDTLVEDFTLSAWIQPYTLDGLQGILTKFTDGAQKQWGLSLDTDASGVTRMSFDYEVDSNNFAVKGGEIQPGVWQHLAVTVSAGTPEELPFVRLYLNGIELTSVSPTQVPALTRSSEVPLILGKWSAAYDTLHGTHFAGNMDEVRIYDQALTPGQLFVLYKDIEADPQDLVVTTETVEGVQPLSPELVQSPQSSINVYEPVEGEGYSYLQIKTSGVDRPFPDTTPDFSVDFFCANQALASPVSSTFGTVVSVLDSYDALCHLTSYGEPQITECTTDALVEGNSADYASAGDVIAVNSLGTTQSFICAGDVEGEDDAWHSCGRADNDAIHYVYCDTTGCVQESTDSTPFDHVDGDQISVQGAIYECVCNDELCSEGNWIPLEEVPPQLVVKTEGSSAIVADAEKTQELVLQGGITHTCDASTYGHVFNADREYDVLCSSDGFETPDKETRFFFSECDTDYYYESIAGAYVSGNNGAQEVFASTSLEIGYLCAPYSSGGNDYETWHICGEQFRSSEGKKRNDGDVIIIEDIAWQCNCEDVSCSKGEWTQLSSTGGIEPVIRYTFEKNALDEQGRYDATVMPYDPLSQDYSSSGIRNFAFTLDGVKDTMQVFNAPSIDLTKEFTLEAWVYPTDLESWNGILTKFDDSTQKQFGLSLQKIDGKNQLSFDYEYEGNDFSVKGGDFEVGRWYYVAATIDSDLDIQLFVDGKPVGPTIRAPAETEENFNPVMIGSWSKDYIHAGNGYYFNGLIDEARVTSRVLSQKEILDLYEEYQERFIRSLYRLALFRDEDQGGMDFYKERLLLGSMDSRLTIVNNFLYSPEYLGNTIDTIYENLEVTPPTTERRSELIELLGSNTIRSFDVEKEALLTEEFRNNARANLQYDCPSSYDDETCGNFRLLKTLDEKLYQAEDDPLNHAFHLAWLVSTNDQERGAAYVDFVFAFRERNIENGIEVPVAVEENRAYYYSQEYIDLIKDDPAHHPCTEYPEPGSLECLSLRYGYAVLTDVAGSIGASRWLDRAFLDYFMTADPYEGIINAYLHDQRHYYGMIDDWYNRFLCRDSETGGRLFWAEELFTQNEQFVQSRILISPEYLSIFYDNVGICPEDNTCGNGILEAGEQCDDGNDNPDDSCNDICELNRDSLCGSADAGFILEESLILDSRLPEHTGSSEQLEKLHSFNLDAGSYAVRIATGAWSQWDIDDKETRQGPYGYTWSANAHVYSGEFHEIFGSSSLYPTSTDAQSSGVGMVSSVIAHEGGPFYVYLGDDPSYLHDNRGTLEIEIYSCQNDCHTTTCYCEEHTDCPDEFYCYTGTCVTPACGNGIIEPLNGESCDPGVKGDWEGCSADCRADICFDSDYGNEPYVHGETTGFIDNQYDEIVTREDYCLANGEDITEFYCSESIVTQDDVTCNFGCAEEFGVCICKLGEPCPEGYLCGEACIGDSCENICQCDDALCADACDDEGNCGGQCHNNVCVIGNLACTDDDNTLTPLGEIDTKSFFRRASAYTELPDGTYPESESDLCQGDEVIEYYCQGPELKNHLFSCPQGCVDGACTCETDDQCPEKYSCEEGSCTYTFCEESDGGKEPYVAGTLYTGGDVLYVDQCVPYGNSDYGKCKSTACVVEQYCSSGAKEELIGCPLGCTDGACVCEVDSQCPENYNCINDKCIEQPPGCLDTDELDGDGIRKFVYGAVTQSYDEESPHLDSCLPTGQSSECDDGNDCIEEFYCEDGYYESVILGCPEEGCVDGACLCNEDSQCGEGYRCDENNRCVCANDNACENNLVCLPDGMCGCTDDSQCPEGNMCDADGICVPDDRFCTDLDGGISPEQYFVLSRMSASDWEFEEDYCMVVNLSANQFTVKEHFCGLYNLPETEVSTYCPEGCEDGVCLCDPDAVPSQCPQHFVCNEHNKCVCDNDNACPDSLTCLPDGFCGCTDDSQCPENLICNGDARCVAPDQLCIDNDGGVSPSQYFVLSGLISTQYQAEDFCMQNGVVEEIASCSGEDCTVLENICNAQSLPDTEISTICPEGCDGGVCLCDPDATVSQCPSGFMCNENNKCVCDPDGNGDEVCEGSLICLPTGNCGCTENSHCPDQYFCNEDSRCEYFEASCSDSDGGSDPSQFFAQGYLTTNVNAEEYDGVLDYCVVGDSVVESCDESEDCVVMEHACTLSNEPSQYKSISCPEGCDRGACKCNDDSQCPLGYACVDNRCICNDDSDCGAGYVCGEDGSCTDNYCGDTVCSETESCSICSQDCGECEDDLGIAGSNANVMCGYREVNNNLWMKQKLGNLDISEFVPSEVIIEEIYSDPELYHQIEDGSYDRAVQKVIEIVTTEYYSLAPNSCPCATNGPNLGGCSNGAGVAPTAVNSLLGSQSGSIEDWSGAVHSLLRTMGVPSNKVFSLHYDYGFGVLPDGGGNVGTNWIVTTAYVSDSGAPWFINPSCHPVVSQTLARSQWECGCEGTSTNYLAWSNDEQSTRFGNLNGFEVQCG